MIVGIETSRQLPDDPLVRVTEDGQVFRRVNIHHPERRQWLKFKQQLDKDGYSYLRLAGTKWLIHRLVYSLYVGPLVPGLVVCHRDGIRTNNHWGNLLQATQLENISHKVQHGTHREGETHHRALHSVDQVLAVRLALASAKRSKTGRLKKGEAQRISTQLQVNYSLVQDLSSSSKNAWRSIC